MSDYRQLTSSTRALLRQPTHDVQRARLRTEMRKKNVTSIGETNILFVGGDVPGAPFKTITANLTFARQGNAVIKPSPAGKVDATKEQTDEESIIWLHEI